MTHLRLLFLSLEIWCIFSIYWSRDTDRSSAGSGRVESRRSRNIHLWLLHSSLILLFLPVPGLRSRFLPSELWMSLTGLVIQLTSSGLAIWSRSVLGRHWRGEIAIADDHELVRSGPYRRIRHPIYAGFLGMSIGTAMVSGEAHALLGLLLVVISYARKIRIEEALPWRELRLGWSGAFMLLGLFGLYIVIVIWSLSASHVAAPVGELTIR